MPPQYYQKPEAALKRAQELIQVGKELDALETLHDNIKVKESLLIKSISGLIGDPRTTEMHDEIVNLKGKICIIEDQSEIFAGPPQQAMVADARTDHVQASRAVRHSAKATHGKRCTLPVQGIDATGTADIRVE